MALCFYALSTYAQEKSALPLQWQVGHMEKATERPSTYYPATVPGAVQHDYQEGKNLPHFSIGTNVDIYKELEDFYWCYQTTFSRPKLETDEELVWQSQTLQAIGYKAIFEEGRRQKPYCSMVLNWCLNEPWPTAANNSIIAYPNLKKPSFEAVQAALRPVMASAKFERFDFLAGDQLEFDLWVLNDRYKKLDGGLIKAFLTTDGQRKQIGSWHFDPVEANQNLEGPRIRYQIPAGLTPQLAKLSVQVEGEEALHSDYFVLIKTRSQPTVDANRLNY